MLDVDFQLDIEIYSEDKSKDEFDTEGDRKFDELADKIYDTIFDKDPFLFMKERKVYLGFTIEENDIENFKNMIEERLGIKVINHIIS